MAVGVACLPPASDWLSEAEAPPLGSARRSAGRSAPVAVLRGVGWRVLCEGAGSERPGVPLCHVGRGEKLPERGERGEGESPRRP